MILAMFTDEAGLARALARLRDAHVGPLETYTPAPMQDAPTSSPIPLIVLSAGLLGGAASFGLQTYSFTQAYQFHIGGRPEFSWASFLPTTFENAILAAIVAGFIAFFAINGLPRHYDPVDESAAIRRASRDRWFVQVKSQDKEMLQAATTILGEMHPISIEELNG